MSKLDSIKRAIKEETINTSRRTKGIKNKCVGARPGYHNIMMRCKRTATVLLPFNTGRTCEPVAFCDECNTEWEEGIQLIMEELNGQSI